MILFHSQLVSAFLAKGGKFQGQGDSISAQEVLAGNGGERLSSWFRQAPKFLKQSAPKMEQSHW